jgi:Zinc finger, C3HC4 type (RING finger)
MICFEEFHPDERYPVVLPCGHTYVCNLCGDRLDKCMECRTPLFITVPRNHNHLQHNATNARTPSYRTPRQPPSPPMPPVKKRLPLPKNVVLLSLIEATELATEDATKSEASPRNHKSDVSEYNAEIFDHHHGQFPGEESSVAVIVDADDLEEERIKLGTSMAVSVAGTYAVTDPKGLPIFPTRPSRAKAEDAYRKDNSQHTSDEDVDKLVRYFHLDQKLEVESNDDDLKENRQKEQPPAQLSCGDRVQVVAIENGWAKLARGYGYVPADDNKLVKGKLDVLSFLVAYGSANFVLTLIFLPSSFSRQFCRPGMQTRSNA